MTVSQRFNNILAIRREQRNGATVEHVQENKENKPMENFITKLTAYRDEILKDLAELKDYDDSAEIEKEVAAYREELTKEYAAVKESKINKMESDIQCIEVLIQREQTISEV